MHPDYGYADHASYAPSAVNDGYVREAVRGVLIVVVDSFFQDGLCAPDRCRACFCRVSLWTHPSRRDMRMRVWLRQM